MNTGNKVRFSKARRLSGPSSLALLLLCVIFAAIPKLQAQTVDVQAMQELVQRWIVIEQQESALLTDWQQQRQILQQRLQLLGEEKAQLDQMLSSNNSESDEVTQRRLSLLELQNTMEADQSEMAQSLRTAFGSINSLHPQLPPPLVNAWQERLSNLTRETANDEDINSNLQLQTLLEMLTQLRDFQQRINLHEDTINFPDGSEILVKQIYLGLSHAWYVSADGQFAGYGQSRPNGWTWLNDPATDAATVQRAVAMLERNVDVQLIELPLILQRPPLSAANEETL